MVQDEDVLVTAGREYWEAACLVRLIFGGLGVGVYDCGKDVIGVLLLLGVDVVAELLVGSVGSKIVLFLIKVALDGEGRPRKMF